MPTTTSLASPSSRSNRFRSRSSLTTAATIAAMAAPSLARAAIVWSGTLNAVVNSGTTSTPLDFNFNTSADPEEATLNYASFKGDVHYALSGNASYKTDPGVAFLYDDTPVSFGATIDNSLNFIGEHPVLTQDGVSKYFAFEYQAAGGPYYGWVQLTIAGDGSSGTLQQWAYNDVSGASLTAGQTSAIPEPTTYAALLGGAALGAVWWRNRRAGGRRA